MIGVVADDTTGANDIGLMFSKNHYTVKILTFHEDLQLGDKPDVLIIDTDSRLDSEEDSYQKVFKATNLLKELGCTQFFNKTCSVFRGNIGKEFDAMLDALNEEFAVISLAFPKNGRQTINGVHTVHGKLLEHSEFANDPVHPMVDSNLVRILESQTSRKVSLITLDVLRKGSDVLRNEIENKRKSSNYCIVDSETQKDLQIVAEAVHDLKILCGSSAIAEELPIFLKIEPVSNPLKEINISDKNGVLIVSGSLTPQTYAQTMHLMEQGTPSIILDSRLVFSPEKRAKEIGRMVLEIESLIKKGKDVLIMADNRKEVVMETKEIGRRLEMNDLLTSKMVSQVLAEVAEKVIDDTELQRLVVAGGDTSGTVCRQLGITGNYVLEEIETGLPSGLALGRNMLIVLKSGSFGKEDFLEKAVKHLKKLTVA